MRSVLPVRDRHTELQALKLALTPHEQNNDVRKAITIMLVASWCIVFIGIAYGAAVPTEMFGLLSAFVGAWVSKMQEQEAQRLSDEKNE